MSPSLDNPLLLRRSRALRELQRPCRLCPRQCGVDRDREPGYCKQPLSLQVALVRGHGGEEPAISGRRGAGTIFACGCTMRCRFCQNHQISQAAAPVDRSAWIDRGLRRGMSVDELARRMLALQEQGCHNIEWVSPTQHLPPLVEALRLARRGGLRLPVVYNSNGFERILVLELLEGIVDVYLPDAKYGDDDLARRLSGTAGYTGQNRRALKEMWRQVGRLETDDEGVARRGLIIRHLALPGHVADTRRVLRWIADNLGLEVWISLLAQYFPTHRVPEGDRLSRRLSRREYEQACAAVLDAGFENGWVQERACGRSFRPDFTRDDPFDAAERPEG